VEVRALLKGDYPEVVKRKIFLSASGAVYGRRVCLLCGGDGVSSRVHVPPVALRVDYPDFRGIRSYWLCLVHQALEPEDAQLTAALQGKARQGEAQRDEQGTTP